MRLHYGALKPFEKQTGISANLISAYLRGKKPMSKTRAFVLADSSRQLGYDFTASDWMFSPEKIKQALLDNADNFQRSEKHQAA
jgi:transcriptional regulator with XRE-family HTH domain